MKSKLIALALAVALAVSGTGLAAAGSVSPDPADAPTPDDSTDAADDAATDAPADDDTANATRLTAEESISMSVGENTTVVEDDPVRITADDSFTLDLSSGEIESAGDGLFVIELPDAPNEHGTDADEAGEAES
jgi:hypothetical protein